MATSQILPAVMTNIFNVNGSALSSDILRPPFLVECIIVYQGRFLACSFLWPIPNSPSSSLSYHVRRRHVCDTREQCRQGV